jgi:hypothetical protein
MRSFELGEELLDVPYVSFSGLFRALPDSFTGIGARCDIEQALIGFRILHNLSSFDGESRRALDLLRLPHGRLLLHLGLDGFQLLSRFGPLALRR